MSKPIFERFLGTWVLDPATCQYEQGPPPVSATYHFASEKGEAVITMSWSDADAETHSMTFNGPTDGTLVPFNGGQLADALSIEAPTELELHSSAYLHQLELMTAKRTLSADGTEMTVRQTVILPDGTMPTNIAIYRRMM